VLRERALDIYAHLRQANQPAPTVALLNVAAGPSSAGVDLLLLRPRALLAGTLRTFDGPIEALPGRPWRGLGGATPPLPGPSPLDVARAARDAVALRLRDPLDRWGVPRAPRILGAVVLFPAIHPDSRISLDIDDHRQGLKVLGLDELAGVAAMVSSGVELTEEQMRAVAEHVFGGRLWVDGGRMLFDLAPARFALRLLDGERAGEAVPLPEGETVVGRRRTARRYERRVAIGGDDLISSDHALLLCGDDEAVRLRDTSKNGTWIVRSDGQEQHLRGAEQVLAPGAVLRMGVTRMRLERLND
jgi:hypothetical protein